jgi:hypothetical protein
LTTRDRSSHLTYLVAGTPRAATDSPGYTGAVPLFSTSAWFLWLPTVPKRPTHGQPVPAEDEPSRRPAARAQGSPNRRRPEAPSTDDEAVDIALTAGDSSFTAARAFVQ